MTRIHWLACGWLAAGLMLGAGDAEGAIYSGNVTNGSTSTPKLDAAGTAWEPFSNAQATPNAGKSSLLNALARREAAIVSEEAGTTRDIIEVTLDLADVPVILSDSAGIREAAGRVESEGIRRALAQARAADLVLWLTDATAPRAELPPADLTASAGEVLRIVNKVDLLEARLSGAEAAGAPLRISVLTGEGLSELAQAVGRRAAERTGGSEAPVITQARHRQQLSACAEALEAYLGGSPADLELRAEDLRRAATALGRITGRVDVEDVLGEIFGRFCIGK